MAPLWPTEGKYWLRSFHYIVSLEIAVTCVNHVHYTVFISPPPWLWISWLRVINQHRRGCTAGYGMDRTFAGYCQYGSYEDR